MALIKKLTKTGTSYSIIIDKSIMQLLSIEPESELEITTDGEALIIKPVSAENVDKDARREKFLNALEKSHSKFGGAYKRLAE